MVCLSQTRSVYRRHDLSTVNTMCLQQLYVAKFLLNSCCTYGIANVGMLYDEYIREYQEYSELNEEQFITMVIKLCPHVSRDVNTLEGISLRKKALYEN